MRAKVKQQPILVGDKVIGMSMEVESEDGDPEFGRCVAVGCPALASTETFTGLHFCDEHWSKWYSPDDFQIDRTREFIDARFLK